ncbi:MAG TPA: FxSxx-COOH system tetratricopeptide repeat protein [Trebonia sp.]|nr:FxSxx-COOH system tetratricopeptide repeat protein [Trebonia sp.]
MAPVTAPDSLERPRLTPRIWYGVPPRNRNFTGRDDILEQMRQRMTTTPTAVLPFDDSPPQALQGLGGVGKTAVAIEYAWRYRTEYDLVCWIRADQMPLVRSSLAALGAAVGLEPSVNGIDLTTAGVLDALRLGEPYSRWLLIFDNADQPEDLLPLIPSGPGDVLITSRNHRWQSEVSTVPLDVFERGESVSFLQKRVSSRLSAVDANRLSEKLGDLPLALVQAAAVIFEGAMPVNEYLRLLDERVTQILEKGASPEYPTSMSAAWQISVARLRTQSSQALDLLRCCAFMGPEPIPRDVFNLGDEESMTGVGDLIADPIDLSTAISTLGRFALVKIDGPYITVHRLIQALLRDELSQEEQRMYRQDAHAMLATAAPGNPSDVSVWPRYVDLVAHVSSANSDLANCQMTAHRALALDIVRYLYYSGDFTSCLSLAEAFITQWTEASGAEDPHVLDLRRNLGNALRELGRAEESHEVIATTMSSAERVLGSKNPLTLTLRNAYGADLRARGAFPEARDLDKETRALHEEVFGPTDPQTLRVLNNLALDYGLNSDFIASRELHKQVYVLWRDPKTNVTPTEILNSWTGLARAVRLCGNYGQARDLGEDARHYGMHELGSEHHLTLRGAIDLSIAMRMIPAYRDDAFELASEMLELCKRRRGGENADTMAATISVSNVLRTNGDVDRALALATSTSEIYPGVYGPAHPYNYGCMGNLAVLRRLDGDPAEARRLNEIALAGLDQRLTRNHLFSLTVALNLASDLAAAGNASAARALGVDSMRRLTTLLGNYHPLTLGCASNLVLDLRADGADEEAELLSAKTQAGFERFPETEHPMSGSSAGPRLDFDFDPPPI